MKLAFYCNYLNHHQAPIANALYELLGEEFVFVATLPRNEKELKGGQDYSLRPYCLLAGESEAGHKEALRLAREAEVCVFGACSQEYAVERAKQRDCGLAFEVGERWLKRGWINVLSPVLRQWWWNYMRYYRKKPFYKLCASAFTAQDDEKLGCYKGRHYKWGYFTEVPSEVSSSKFNVSSNLCNLKPSETNNNLKPSETTKLMWCARFIDWKHPELAIDCARRLKEDGYKFELHMYGDGPLRESLELRTESLGMNNEVKFHGNVPNTQIQQAMQESDILLFTSDRQEGWGAVANEAMTNGCCLVGSDEIGAVPYLVEHQKNGMIFKSKSSADLYDKVKFLIDNTENRKIMAEVGTKEMINLWSPRHAAESLIMLIEELQKGENSFIEKGPCSKA